MPVYSGTSRFTLRAYLHSDHSISSFTALRHSDSLGPTCCLAAPTLLLRIVRGTVTLAGLTRHAWLALHEQAPLVHPSRLPCVLRFACSCIVLLVHSSSCSCIFCSCTRRLARACFCARAFVLGLVHRVVVFCFLPVSDCIISSRLSLDDSDTYRSEWRRPLRTPRRLLRRAPIPSLCMSTERSPLSPRHPHPEHLQRRIVPTLPPPLSLRPLRRQTLPRRPSWRHSAQARPRRSYVLRRQALTEATT